MCYIEAQAMAVPGSSTTVFVGSYYEKTGSTVTKYYMAGGQRVAMRKSGVVYWLVGDHAAGQRTPGLGSTSVVANQNATVHSRQLYKPWGELRHPLTSSLPTKFQYTGQYSYVADFGLYYYVARFYDPQLGRFSQADTVTPGGVQGLDRYAGMANNPLRYVDPTGHRECDSEFGSDCNGGEGVGENGSISLGSGSDEMVTDPCENWEICLLAAVVMSETNRGTYPAEWMEIIAWTYLNLDFGHFYMQQ